MMIDYVMPKLAMAMNEGTIVEWLFQQGDYVSENDSLLTLETEKVSYDVESPTTGYLNILVNDGKVVDVGTVIAQFATTKEELLTIGSEENMTQQASQLIDAKNQAPKQQNTDAEANTPIIDVIERIKASPLARKMASDANLEIRQVNGTGPNNRIVKRDILAYIENQSTSKINSDIKVLSTIPLKGIRKTTANNLQQSLQSSAQVSASWDSDITKLLELKQQLASDSALPNFSISINSFIIKAMILAIKHIPIANSSLIGNNIIIYDDINVGIAVSLAKPDSLDSALIVPVLKNVKNMSIPDIDINLKSLIERARNNELQPDETSGSTITLSSTAGIGPPGLKNTPILNYPNSVIIGPSTPKLQPCIVEEEVTARNIMPISLTFDHRVIHGELIARFMKHMHQYLEDPILSLLF